MSGLLLSAKENGIKLLMIYMNDKGVITERYITVRVFKRSNILSIGLQRKAG